MPTQKAGQACATVGCPNVANNGARCLQCSKTHNQTQERDRFYDTARWRKLSKLKRQTDPLCEPCLEAGRSTLAECVDHTLPREERPDLELDWDNLRSMCWPCHSEKTRRDEARVRGDVPG